MKRSVNLVTAIAIAVLCCALTFVITWCEFDKISPVLYGYRAENAEMEKTISEQEEKLDEVSKYFELKEIIDTYYVGDYDQQELTDMMATGVVAGISDQWSYYLTADAYEEYMLSNANVYKGIGITISAETDYNGYQIVRVAEEGSAREAGFKVGDIIIAVEGTDITGMDISTVKGMVQGEDGTGVTITVIRDGKELDLTAVRGTATYEIVRYELLEDNVGYIKIYNFEGNSAIKFIEAVEEMKAQGAEGFVFDVRNNPGGLMDQLLLIIDYVLPEGETFIQKSSSGKSVTYTSDEKCLDMPMTVLVNENSFSAAEFFAAIVQEFDAGPVVGTKTTGKGYYQTPIRLSDGSAVVLSVGEYFTPSGKSLAETGVTPEYEIEIDSEQFAFLYYDQLDYSEDEQLIQAVHLTKTAID